jgi:hypothetical protein
MNVIAARSALWVAKKTRTKCNDFVALINTASQSQLHPPKEKPPKIVANRSNDEVMKKIDMNDLSKLSPIQQMYIRKLSEINSERYARERKLKKHKRIIGVILCAFVLSVYFYTMLAIKQEKFLDDFDVPEPPNPPELNPKAKSPH